MSPKDPTQVKLFTRRRFLPWLITGVAGVGFGLSIVRELFGSDELPAAPKYKGLKPRHRKRSTIEPLKHDRGFYLYSETNVIHYFPEAKATRFTGDINYLQPIDPTRVAIHPPKPHLPRSRVAGDDFSKRKLPPPHMNQLRASFAFEYEAVAKINAKNYQLAFDLLIYAIQAELQSNYGPSFRLYDLLAGLCLRFDRVDLLKRMIEVIKSSKNDRVQSALDGRIKKWQDPQSRWYKRWSDRSKQIKWTTVDGRTGLVLLM